MSYMERAPVEQLPASELHHADEGEVETSGTSPSTPHLQSLITPGLLSGPVLPMWVRRLFKRATAAN